MNAVATPQVNRMRLADGRTLAWAEYGDPRGVPVFYFHGGGASFIEAGCFHREAQDSGIRLVAPSRPGGLHSSPRPGMKTTDFASDCVELADQLGIGRFVVTGNSNGGLFTMAVAHQLPDRVIGAVPINSTVPLYHPAVWPVAPWPLKAVMLFYRAFPRLFIPTVTQALKHAKNRMFPADAEPEVVQIYCDNVMSASQQSMLPEIGFMNRRWDFDHRAIRCPVRMLYGRQDTGCRYGPHWAAALPDARFMEIPDGHVPIAPGTRRILAATWLSLSERQP